jgi:hypothetical protein
VQRKPECDTSISQEGTTGACCACLPKRCARQTSHALSESTVAQKVRCRGWLGQIGSQNSTSAVHMLLLGWIMCFLR